MNDVAGLTEAETAYVRRFWFEISHGPDGPNTTLQDCRGYHTSHYYDLATLAAVSEIQDDERLLPRHFREPTDSGDLDTPPPSVPFPWPSLEALHDRAAEFAPISERGRAVFSLTNSRRF